MVHRGPPRTRPCCGDISVHPDCPQCFTIRVSPSRFKSALRARASEWAGGDTFSLASDADGCA
eukprot:1813726-Pyramimonas_sp.AAC.1